MTSVILNRLIAKFATRVKVLDVATGFLMIKLGPRVYQIRCDHTGFEVREYVMGAQGCGDKTPYATWLTGVLQGKTRNDAGELVG